MEIKNILVGVIIFLTNMLEGITGFGSTVLALPFLNPLIGIHNAVRLFGVLGWMMALYIVVRSWRDIVWKEFLFIVLWVGLGLPFGMWMFEAFPAYGLCVILAVFMMIVGVRGTIVTRRNRNQPPVPGNSKRTVWMRILLFCGGIIQGAFGSGRPFVVIYAAKAIPEKRVFRVTLSLLWVSMNLVRLGHWSMTGELYTASMGELLIFCLPVMAAGVILGDYLHRKVSEYYFRLGVYILLGIGGVFMLADNIRKILA